MTSTILDVIHLSHTIDALGLELPDLANKNEKHPAEFQFQINNFLLYFNCLMFIFGR